MNEMARLTVRVGTKHDTTSFDLGLAQLAATRQGTCYLLGVVATQGGLKGLRGAINSAKEKSVSFWLEGAWVSDGGEPREARRLLIDPAHRFTWHTAALGYGQIHALLISQEPGFLRTDDDRSLYAALKGPAYTTPLLEGWIPEVRAGLLSADLLEPLWCMGCRCALLAGDSDNLDLIVTEAVKLDVLPFTTAMETTR